MQFGIQFFPDVGPQHKAAEIIDNINMYQEETGGFEHATMQVNFHNLDYAEAERSMRMFAEEVMPVFGQGVK